MHAILFHAIMEQHVNQSHYETMSVTVLLAFMDITANIRLMHALVIRATMGAPAKFWNREDSAVTVLQVLFYSHLNETLSCVEIELN